jgi:hypothetical protein
MGAALESGASAGDVRSVGSRCRGYSGGPRPGICAIPIAELSASLEPHAIIDPAKPDLGEGRMVDDYWAVQNIDANTYALGEPRYYQANYSYLIVGGQRALLFDAGSGTRDITSVVTSLTHLPVTVMPSHLHFDHTGGIAPFTSVAMIDLPDTRADVTNGRFTPSRYEYLGMIDGLVPPTFSVTEWLSPAQRLISAGACCGSYMCQATRTAPSLCTTRRRISSLREISCTPRRSTRSCRERASRNIGRRRENYSRRCPPIQKSGQRTAVASASVHPRPG